MLDECYVGKLWNPGRPSRRRARWWLAPDGTVQRGGYRKQTPAGEEACEVARDPDGGYTVTLREVDGVETRTACGDGPLVPGEAAAMTGLALLLDAGLLEPGRARPALGLDPAPIGDPGVASVEALPPDTRAPYPRDAPPRRSGAGCGPRGRGPSASRRTASPRMGRLLGVDQLTWRGPRELSPGAAGRGAATELMLDLAGVRAGRGCSTWEPAPARGRCWPPGAWSRPAASWRRTSERACPPGRRRRPAGGPAPRPDAGHRRAAPRVRAGDLRRGHLAARPQPPAEPPATPAGIRRVLTPGGRVAALVYAAPEGNPIAALSPAVAARRGLHPGVAPWRPGVCALGDPGAFEALLRTAGLAGEAVQAVAAPRPYPVHRRRGAGPPRASASPGGDGDTRRRRARGGPVRGRAGPPRFVEGGGFEAPGEVLVGAGTRPYAGAPPTR